MNILYIDTSSNYLYTGIFRADKLITCKKIKYNNDLSKYSILEISKMFEENDMEPQDIDKIIVVSGPGSFTGIRIGMTFAKIYAYCLDKEITTITSLDAMSVRNDSDKIIVPIIDARRGYVYAGAYLNDEVIIENQYIKLTDLIEKLNKMDKEYLIISNDKFENLGVLEYEPDIEKIILKYMGKTSINPHLVEPTYFKLTEAEENKINVG